jgi:ATP-binding cassette, subfamily B, bacterial
MYKRALDKNQNQEPTMFLFRKMWEFSAGNRKNVVIYILFFIISNILGLLGPLIIAFFLNELQVNGLSEQNFWYLVTIISGLMVLTLLFWFFHGIGRVLETKNAFMVRYAYQKYLLQGVLDLDLAWHTNRDSGDTIDKVNKASDGLFRFSREIYQIMNIIVGFSGTVIALMYFNYAIALGVLIFMIFGFFIITRFDKYLVPQYADLNRYDNKILAKVFDVLSNVTSIIVLKIRGVTIKSIEHSQLAPKALYYKNVVLNEWKWFTGSILVELIVVVPLIVYLAINLKSGAVLEIGTISALYLYLSRFSNVFFNFTYLYEEIIRMKTNVLNVADVEAVFPKKKQKIKKQVCRESVEIKHLNFNYQRQDKPVRGGLKDISIAFKKGERIALIGESGSGKTTFLKVLHGLYRNAKMDIILDGVKLKRVFSDYDLGTMLVPQEPELFSSSIRENITFGLEYGDDEILKFTDLAQFTKVIEDLPRGLDSVINEKGVNLSGGQKQRLALARALLFAQEKEIILLDESTSSVDSHTEAKIYQELSAFFVGKTIIASVHKLNLLKYFDRIVIFCRGEIADEGTFEDLLIRNQAFRDSWDEYSRTQKV